MKSDPLTIDASDVPQFSSFEDGTVRLTKLLMWHAPEGATFLRLGRLLLPEGKSKCAYKKYGENHAKLGQMLGLVSVSSERPRVVRLAGGGETLRGADLAEQERLLGDAIVNTRIVSVLLGLLTTRKSVRIRYWLMENGLSESTARRRAPNVRCLIRKLDDYAHPLAAPLREGVL